MLLKSAVRIRISAIRYNSKNPKSVENPSFFKTDFCKNPNPTSKFDGLPSLILRSNNFYLYLWFTMSNLGILFLKWLRLGYTMKKGKIVQPLLFFLHLLNCLKFLWWKLFLSIKMSFSPLLYKELDKLRYICIINRNIVIIHFITSDSVIEKYPKTTLKLKIKKH